MTTPREIVDAVPARQGPVLPVEGEDGPPDAQELALELGAGMLMLGAKGYHFAIVDSPSPVRVAGEAPPRKLALHDMDCRPLGGIPLRWEGSVPR